MRDLLVQAQSSLDVALSAMKDDPGAAIDDLLAARLLVATALASIDRPDERQRTT